MKITYTGKLEHFSPKPRQKFEVKLQKLSKMLERKGEKEAHVILTHERFLKKVEITIHAFDHAIVGQGSNGDLAMAAADAAENLEKQVLRIRNKWRDKRRKDKGAETSSPEPQAAPARQSAPAVRKAKAATSKASRKRVFRVEHEEGAKPMTAEEAMFEMEPKRDYLTYRDSQTGRLSVLFRRPDGNFDLIET